MTKLLLTIALVATTLNSFADSSVKVKSKSRTLGEEVMAVSECSTPSGNITGTTELAGPDKNGEYYNVPATRISAKTVLIVKKCLLKEDYQVDVTGSFWNSKESEKPGTATKRYEATEQEISSDDSQVIRDQKNTTFGGDNTAEVAMNILEGLKAKTYKACQTKKSQLSQVIKSDLKCSN